MPIEDMCCERSVGAEPLSAHGFGNASIMFSHVANMVAVRIKNDISVCLFETKENVHHLNLPLHHNAGLGE